MNSIFTSHPLPEEQLNDKEIIKLVPGFTNRNAKVNGINLHYVEGGEGEPLILIPGYPETWWAYHKVMPMLMKNYHVIVVDIRGMGSSDKPRNGYDKKNMARDILELVDTLSFSKVHICGHDIGAHVAFSFAANFAERTSKLIVLDTPHPDASMYQLPMLPIPGLVYTFPWWVAFNQVKDLPEKLLIGRLNFQFEWMFDHLLIDQSSINEFDRAVYVHAYDCEDGIRASNRWYQAFPQDIEDSKSYDRITIPTLGLGGSGFDMLKQALSATVVEPEFVKIEGCGHFMLAEKPIETAEAMMMFLGI